MSLTRSDDGNFVATVMSGAFKANLNWITNVIRDCFGFALLRYVIGQENSHHLFNQSD